MLCLPTPHFVCAPNDPTLDMWILRFGSYQDKDGVGNPYILTNYHRREDGSHFVHSFVTTGTRGDNLPPFFSGRVAVDAVSV